MLLAVIVTVLDTDFVVSAVEVALMVTVFPVGTVAGAVYTVAAPLAVWTGLNEPQATLPQVTVQSAPLPAGSFEMEAVILAVLLITKLDGGAIVNDTEITSAVMVTGLAFADLVASAVEVAVMVTVLPEGTLAGAV